MLSFQGKLIMFFGFFLKFFLPTCVVGCGVVYPGALGQRSIWDCCISKGAGF